MANGAGKSDLSKALDRLNDTLTEVPAAPLQAAGELAISIITLRTKKGLDADGQVFKPYVKRYAQWRANRKLRVTPPDLAVTGHMLGSMLPVATGANEVTIEFSPQEIPKVIGNSNKRDFFDVRQPAELDAIADELGDWLIAEILK